MATAVSALLGEAPGLRVAVTSRRPLGVEDERILSVGALDEAAAVRLMVDRARRVRWDYRPDRDELALLGRLAIDELDGLPLALELAAARLGVMGAKGLAERLDRGEPVAARGSRNDTQLEQYQPQPTPNFLRPRGWVHLLDTTAMEPRSHVELHTTSSDGPRERRPY